MNKLELIGYKEITKEQFNRLKPNNGIRLFDQYNNYKQHYFINGNDKNPYICKKTLTGGYEPEKT